MRLKKKFLAGLLTLVMIVSSLQLSTEIVLAEEVSGEILDTTEVTEGADTEQEDTSENTDNKEETDSEDEVSETGENESNTEDTDSDESEDLNETDDSEQPGTDDTQQSETDTSDEETEDESENLDEEVVESQLESMDAPDSDTQLVTVEAEFEGVYQFGDAPSETGSISAHSVHTASYTDTEAEAYLYEQMKKRNESINVQGYNIECENITSLISSVLNEHPDLYFVNKKWSYSYSGTTVISILITYDNSLDDDAFQREVASAKAVIDAEMTDLEKAIVLHDYLATNCEYDYQNYLNNNIPSTSYSTYGVFVNRTAVCQGYALAYKYLMNQLGIDCYMVSSNGINHAWNLIKLNNQYYQVDVTWDDPTWDRIGNARHTYMFCSDNNFRKSHSKDENINNYDAIVTNGSNVVNYEASSTSYDNAFWKDCNSSIVLEGDSCYYVSSSDRTIKKTTLSDITATGTTICEIGKWSSGNGSYWLSAFSGLFQINNRLYYNDSSSIYSIAFDGSDKRTEFSLTDTSQGNIYGSALCQDKVLYCLRQTPNLDGKETVLEADISASIPYITVTKDKTSYKCGDTLNIDDLTVTCYKEGVSSIVDTYDTNADEIDMSTPGKKLLVIKYNGMTAKVEIFVGAVYTVEFTGTGKDDIAEGTLLKAHEDEDYIFTLVKAEGYNYTVTAVMGEESINPSADETGNTYTIKNVTDNLVITIEKTADQSSEPGTEKKTYTVEFKGSGKDDIAEGTLLEAKEGEDYIFTLVKAEGYDYKVTAVMGEESINPSADETGNTYTIKSVTADLVITIRKTAKQSPEPEDTTGLQIEIANEEDIKCTYTGKAIQPEIKVTYNGKRLIAGTDYTVKYTNNIKIGTATITIIGKGNYKNPNQTTTFQIVEKNIKDQDIALCGASAGTNTLTVASGTKLNPVLYYNNIKLTSKDYVVKNTEGEEILNKKINESDNGATIRIESKPGGNFTGTKEITLNVVENKDLIKFTAAIDKTKINTLTYDGNEHYIHEISGALTVTAKDTNKTPMKYGQDYDIIYQKDVTSAGTKKFTIVGMGRYTGSVNKSYTIQPAKNETLTVTYDGINIAGDKINDEFIYSSTGITFNNKLAVKNKKGDDLVEGRDYKVSYSGNKKVNQNAKCNITFLGNYKGHTKLTVSFAIIKADLGETDVVMADQLYKTKPRIYKSTPYVIADKDGTNSLVSASNYKVAYYTQNPTNNDDAAQMKGSNKVGEGDTVWVKLIAKGNNYFGEKIVSYKIRSANDLSKAKITFKDADGNNVKNTSYTGRKITSAQIKTVVNGKLAEDNADLEVFYINNINKGKATVIVKGTGQYVGCRKATFGIIARDLN